MDMQKDRKKPKVMQRRRPLAKVGMRERDEDRRAWRKVKGGGWKGERKM